MTQPDPYPCAFGKQQPDGRIQWLFSVSCDEPELAREHKGLQLHMLDIGHNRQDVVVSDVVFLAIVTAACVVGLVVGRFLGGRR